MWSCEARDRDTWPCEARGLTVPPTTYGTLTTYDPYPPRTVPSARPCFPAGAAGCRNRARALRSSARLDCRRADAAPGHCRQR
eukprot:1274295-Prymnesium_polylepis.1